MTDQRSYPGSADLGRANRAFHDALRKYPDAFEALHYFWNEGIAGVAQAGTYHLQVIYDEVNALGGRPDQDNSYDQGTVDTVAKVLEIIEKAQAASSLASTDYRPEEVTKAEMDSIEDAAIAGKPLSSTEEK
jgi:hypothetical protein